MLPRLMILAKWLRHFIGLAVGRTPAHAWFSRENAEGTRMQRCQVIEITRHVDARMKRGSISREYVRKYWVRNLNCYMSARSPRLPYRW